MDTGASPLQLDAAARERVRRALETPPRGLITDVDGTISAIAPSPESAALLPGMTELLEQAMRVFAVVAAVSGRSADDARRLVGVAGMHYVGSHGLEWRNPDDDTDGSPHVLPEAESYAEAVALALDEAEETLGVRWPGMRVERKGVTGSIHVRQTDDPPAALDAVTRALTVAAVRHGLRVTTGKLVAEVRPPIAADKGQAVTALIQRHQLRGVLYLGDDRTDLDAFRALHQLAREGVCQAAVVGVLQPEAPPELAAEADLTLPSSADVPPFLRWVIAGDA
jgi:trehalose 6-phosphate phosphatase